ncbi:hypothetical protein [Paraoerskovia marina]|uniref:hypothetical protein n=1 Tax=Paraoerskovia marina TaxID=545619 RepID=UPI0012DD8D7F|nr:hypothetical protein [Paraoerskovia marina]
MRTTAAACGVAAVIAGLGGCANPLDELSESGVEKIVEEGLNSADGEGDSDVDLGIGGSADLPDDWPAEIPTPAGNVVMSTKIDGSWTASISTDTAGVEAYLAELESSGFVSGDEIDLGGMTSATYSASGPYAVTVSSITDDEAAEVVMNVMVLPDEQVE